MLQYIKTHFWEVFRYGIVGGSSAISYIAVSNILDYLSLPSMLSAGGAWLLSLLVSYFGHIHFSYKVNAKHNEYSWRFIAMTGINLANTLLITYLIYNLLGLAYIYASLSVAIINPLVLYPIGKYWVFRPHLNRRQESPK